MPTKSELYQKYLALSKDPRVKAMLDTISKAEGTSVSSNINDGYHTHFGGTYIADLSTKPSNQLETKDGKTSASGRYQFQNGTWNELANELGLTDFFPESQDVAAVLKLEKLGALNHILSGEIEQAIYKAGSVWQGLPKNAAGDRIGKTGGKATTSLKKSIGIYSENLNKSKEGSLNTSEENKKIVRDYKEKYKSIKAQKLSPFAEQKLLDELNEKTYREGNASVINKNVDYRNNKTAEYDKKLAEFNTLKDNLYNTRVSNDDLRRLDILAEDLGIKTNGKFEDIITNVDKGVYNNDGSLTKDNEFLDNIGLGKYPLTRKKPLINIKSETGVNDGKQNASDAFSLIDKEAKAKIIGRIIPEKLTAASGPEKSDIQKIDLDYYKNNISNEATPDATPTPEDIAKAEADKAKADADKLVQEEAEKKAKAKATYEGQVANWNANSVADVFVKDGMFTDAQFQYKEGKAELPFDALAGLGTAIVGMAAGNVEINYRDEQISEGMINYAADLERIKNMGLPPETEADLNNKLADAYSTGMNNLVRASAGNRNLVLGNQGQLDQARMAGIVEIANMDVARRDKAMMAYGEVMKYFNEFDTTRNVANNEREYNQIEKQQMAGAAVAQNGMQNVLDSLQNNRENGPGSANDMYRQAMMFNITGVNANAKPGEVGSPEYQAMITEKNNAHLSESQRAAKWRAGLTKDENYRLTKSLDLEQGWNFNTNRELTADAWIQAATKTLGKFSKDDAINQVYQTQNGAYVTPEQELAPNEKAFNFPTTKLELDKVANFDKTAESNYIDEDFTFASVLNDPTKINNFDDNQNNKTKNNYIGLNHSGFQSVYK